MPKLRKYIGILKIFGMKYQNRNMMTSSNKMVECFCCYWKQEMQSYIAITVQFFILCPMAILQVAREINALICLKSHTNIIK